MQVHKFTVTQHEFCRVRVTVRTQPGAVKQQGNKVVLNAVMVRDGGGGCMHGMQIPHVPLLGSVAGTMSCECASAQPALRMLALLAQRCRQLPCHPPCRCPTIPCACRPTSAQLRRLWQTSFECTAMGPFACQALPSLCFFPPAHFPLALPCLSSLARDATRPLLYAAHMNAFVFCAQLGYTAGSLPFSNLSRFVAPI